MPAIRFYFARWLLRAFRQRSASSFGSRTDLVALPLYACTRIRARVCASWQFRMNFRIFGDTVRASPSSANERMSLVCTPDWRVSVTRTRYFPARSASTICLPSISIATRRDTQKPIFRSVDRVSERANLRAVFIKFYIRHLLDFHLRARAHVFSSKFFHATEPREKMQMQSRNAKCSSAARLKAHLRFSKRRDLLASPERLPAFLVFLVFFCFAESCVYRVRNGRCSRGACAHIKHYKHSIIVMRY